MKYGIWLNYVTAPLKSAFVPNLSYEANKCFNVEWNSYPQDWEFGQHYLYKLNRE